MNINLIKNDSDYRAALERVEDLWRALPNSKEGDELDVLATLIEKYEEHQFKIAAPDPIEAIKFRMEQIGMERSDLAKMIGANRVSEVFNKKRSLSLNIIRILHKKLNIPADSLIGGI
jgi:HTH-type transcriptional regulator / antitoxin HigA